VQRKERFDDRRVVHRAAALRENLQGVAVVETRPVRTVRRQGVEAIHDGENSRADRNALAADAVGVSAAVP
jgi:hypothetical protein